ncbi:MAG: CbiX/SirB N-terminal domain-containing protein [Candidatus Nanopelagicales bacterium]
MTAPVAPLVIAAHGTRDQGGVAACRALTDLVREQLTGVDVSAGFVELQIPSLEHAVASALTRSSGNGVVVVPLMLGRAAHVQNDIPAAISAGRASWPQADVVYSAHLGADPRLLSVNLERAQQALGDWSPNDTTVVFVGRGSHMPEANAEHVRIGRLLQERANFAQVVPAFIQVSKPSLPEGLSQALACGSRRIVVLPNFLFPGRLRNWTWQQSEAWVRANADVQVRVAEVIGPCAGLAAVVADRYLESAPRLSGSTGAPVYLSGLDVRGRDVLVVGGGKVADRRIPGLLAAGASVRLVSPVATQRLRELSERGDVRWEQRGYEARDLDGAWFAMATTDDPAVNAAVAAAAEARHTFCVRADWAPGGSAWTPAVGHAEGLSIAVVGDRTPLRSARARDVALRAVRGMD